MDSLSSIALAQIVEKCAFPTFPTSADAPLEIRQEILVKRILTTCMRACHKCQRHVWRPELSFSSSRYSCDLDNFSLFCGKCLSSDFFHKCRGGLPSNATTKAGDCHKCGRCLHYFTDVDMVGDIYCIYCGQRLNTVVKLIFSGSEILRYA